MLPLFFLTHIQFSSAQSLSLVLLFVTPWTAAHQASLSFTVSRSLLKPMSIQSVMPSSHLILCRLLLLLPSVFPSIRVFPSESALHIRWPEYRSFSISFSYEYSELISFRMDRLDLFAVQGTLQSLVQHHSSKASIFRRSAFFMVRLSHPYMTTGKTTALTIWNFVNNVMSLLLNPLSRLVIAFPPRSKRLLISWLQSPSPVILESVLEIDLGTWEQTCVMKARKKQTVESSYPRQTNPRVLLVRGFWGLTDWHPHESVLVSGVRWEERAVRNQNSRKGGQGLPWRSSD